MRPANHASHAPCASASLPAEPLRSCQDLSSASEIIDYPDRLKKNSRTMSLGVGKRDFCKNSSSARRNASQFTVLHLKNACKLMINGLVILMLQTKTWHQYETKDPCGSRQLSAEVRGVRIHQEYPRESAHVMSRKTKTSGVRKWFRAMLPILDFVTVHQSGGVRVSHAR